MTAVQREICYYLAIIEGDVICTDTPFRESSTLRALKRGYRDASLAGASAVSMGSTYSGSRLTSFNNTFSIAGVSHALYKYVSKMPLYFVQFGGATHVDCFRDVPYL
jgi:hypothetical protein